MVRPSTCKIVVQCRDLHERPFKEHDADVRHTGEQKCAIWTKSKVLNLDDMETIERSSNGYASAKINRVQVYSFYTLPNGVLDARGRFSIIIAGNFNAWSTVWCLNDRGLLLLEAFSLLDIQRKYLHLPQSSTLMRKITRKTSDEVMPRVDWILHLETRQWSFSSSDVC